MSGVDVVVVTWNHAATLAAALAGLEAQGEALASVVVVDNASSDGSSVVAREWTSRLPLQLVETGGNRGFSHAANAGIARGAAPWVLSLNPDCRLEPGFLAELTGAAQEHGAGHACGLLVRAEGNGLHGTAIVDSAGMVVIRSGRHLDRGAGRPATGTWTTPAWVFGATGACALYRRDALESVIYPPSEIFDERFFAYREDADLAWRLQRQGWRCLYWPAARAAHLRGLRPEAGRQGTTEINRHSVRNRFLLRWSNADWRWYLRCFPEWWVRDLVVVAACLTVERSSLPGLREAFRQRSNQRKRGRDNSRRARVSGWRTAGWFTWTGRVESL